jgi:hypothetical protein
MSSRVTITPDPFTLIDYDVGEIAAIIEDAAAIAGFPPGVEISLEVDEELFPPLTGHMVDVVDGRARLWISGANFEDTRRPRHFAPAQARVDLVEMLLRANDRLSEDFAGAPADRELSRGQRVAWDIYAIGRTERLGLPVRRPRELYDFRLQHGFTDVSDAAFERLWDAELMTWAGIREICKETGAADRGPSKVPVDLLRNK